jgi:hypothetical protein
MVVNKKVEKNVIKKQNFGKIAKEIVTKICNCTYKTNNLSLLAFSSDL